MPFKTVEVLLDAPKPSKKGLPTGARLIASNAHVIQIGHLQASSSGRVPVNVRTEGSGLTPDEEIKVERLPQPVSGGQGASFMLDSSDTDQLDASIGDPEPGSSRKNAHAQLTRMKKALMQPDKLSARGSIVAVLAETYAALIQAAQANKWDIVFDDEETIPLPKGKEFEFLMMEISCPAIAPLRAANIFVAEVGAPRGTKALGFLRRKDRKPLNPAIDYEAIKELATKDLGCWRDRKLDDFIIKSVRRHPLQADGSVKDYPGLLERAVARLLAE